METRRRRRGSKGPGKKSRGAKALVRNSKTFMEEVFPSIPHCEGNEQRCEIRVASGRINTAVHCFVLFSPEVTQRMKQNTDEAVPCYGRQRVP